MHHPITALTGPRCRKKGVHQRSCSCLHGHLIPNAELRKRPKSPRRLQLQAVFLPLECLGYRSAPPPQTCLSLKCTNGCWQDNYPPFYPSCCLPLAKGLNPTPQMSPRSLNVRVPWEQSRSLCLSSPTYLSHSFVRSPLMASLALSSWGCFSGV